MGNTVNLQDIMNDVARALDSAVAADFVPSNPASEFDAFLRLDPLLASLNKEYLDAAQIRKQAQHDFGMDDAMTEIAMLTEDSAWCAVQTRYIELLADNALRSQANMMVQEAFHVERKARAKIREKEIRETMEKMQYIAALEDSKKKKDPSAWWIFLLYYVMQMQDFRLPQTTHQFNRLAA